MIGKIAKGLKVVSGVKHLSELAKVAKEIKELGYEAKKVRLEAEKEVLKDKLKDKNVFDLDIVNQKKDKLDTVVMVSIFLTGVLMFFPQTSDAIYRGWVQFEYSPEIFKICVYGLLVKVFGGKVVYDVFKGLKEVMGNRVVNSIEPKKKK